MAMLCVVVLVMSLPCVIMSDSALVCNVAKYGAVGDNSTDDTKAIVAALTACGGRNANMRGTVVFPPGVYLSWPLTIPSYTTLSVEADATLIAQPNYTTWPNSTTDECAITPYEAKNPIYVPTKQNFIVCGDDVEITGGGTIDGQGWRWWHLRFNSNNDYWHNCRPRLVTGYGIKNFVMRNITLRDSPMWNTDFRQLEGASFTHVNIDSNPGIGYTGAPNTDGFNIQGNNIYIGQSRVRNGDDCVPIGAPSKNITVEDICCERGNGQ